MDIPAEVRQALGRCLRQNPLERFQTAGELKAAVAEARVAQELDPLSLPVKSNAGWVYYWARQFDTAIAESRKALEMDENCLQAHYILGLASLAKLSGDKRKQHDSHLLLLGVFPIYDPLRSHPGFSALLREMNLEP